MIRLRKSDSWSRRRQITSKSLSIRCLFLCILPLFGSCASIDEDSYAYLVISAKNIEPNSLQPRWIAFVDSFYLTGEHVSASEPVSKIFAGTYYFSHIDFHENRVLNDFTTPSARNIKRPFRLDTGSVYFVGEIELTPEVAGMNSGFDMELVKDASMIEDICKLLPDLNTKYPFHLIDIKQNGTWEVQPRAEDSVLECVTEPIPT